MHPTLAFPDRPLAGSIKLNQTGSTLFEARPAFLTDTLHCVVYAVIKVEPKNLLSVFTDSLR
jgi:hypothetical protein